jgi:cellulose synthase/poly-beta-1,6-N-acetylglucosamine synthase-like glycosyltransferase
MDHLSILEAEPKSGAFPSNATVLSIIIPTLNERENIEPLLASLTAVLSGIGWEAIFVDDDSRDGTPEHIRAIARRIRACAACSASVGEALRRLAWKDCWRAPPLMSP